MSPRFRVSAVRTNVWRGSLQLDDDLPDVAAVVHEVVGLGGFLERKHAVDDRADLVFGDELVHRLEVGARADVDSSDRRTAGHQAAGSDLAAESGQPADDR